MNDRTVRSHDQVSQPYPRVRDTLLANPHDVFRHATAAASAQAATLHVASARSTSAPTSRSSCSASNTTMRSIDRKRDSRSNGRL